MPGKHLLSAIIFPLCALALSLHAQAGLLGKTLSIGYYTDAALTTLAPSVSVTTFTVANGLDITSWWSATSGPWQIDVSDTQIEIGRRHDLGALANTSIPIRYIGFKDVNGTIADFSSDPTLTFLVHTITNFDASRLAITAESIAFRINNLAVPTYATGGYITLQVGFDNLNPTPIPEPSTISMMLLAAALYRQASSKPYNRSQIDKIPK